MSVAFEWRLLAEKLRSLAAETADKELAASLHRLVCDYETKAAAHDHLSKAYGTQPTSEESEQIAWGAHG